MTDCTISGLFIYPVKSLAGISLRESTVDAYGLAFDRRWMLVDPDGDFLSQRQLPHMSLIKQRIVGGKLLLSGAGLADLSVPLSPKDGARLRVRIWDDRVDAWYCGAEAEAWFSRFLGQSCKLVYLPDNQFRRVDQDYAEPQDGTAFSDGFPLLLISEASLEDLNSRLSHAVSMQRFRPNIVVRGCGPFAEDDWRRVQVERLGLRVVKPCSRCVITTIDLDTAEKGAEPLKTLSCYRRRGNKVYFGQNLLHDSAGILSVGMRLKVLE